MRVRGPIEEDSVTLNVSKTSQHLSALLLSMPASSNPLNLNIEGKLVSRRHAELSFTLANKCGSSNTIENPVLRPWRCEPPTNRANEEDVVSILTRSRSHYRWFQN